MAIIINIDVMLAKRKMSVTEIADKVGITLANISVLKKRQSKGDPFIDSGSNLQGSGVSAWWGVGKLRRGG